MEYRASTRISRWGISYDSLLELKYACLVSLDYEFLRNPVSIYYDPKNLLPVRRIIRNTLRYTPDFLIRHKLTQEAFLVEIKPRCFQFHPQISRRKAVAENYIRFKDFDWKFKTVFDDEIVLDHENHKLYLQLIPAGKVPDSDLPSGSYLSGSRIQFLFYGPPKEKTLIAS
jgi:hypothetical protein